MLSMQNTYHRLVQKLKFPVQVIEKGGSTLVRYNMLTMDFSICYCLLMQALENIDVFLANGRSIAY
jgi:hypothetical protein